MLLQMKNSILIILFLLYSIIGLSQTDKSVIKLNDSTTVELERTEFNASEKKIDYYADKIPIGINGKLILGTDGKLPIYKLTKATLILGTRKYDLQVENMYNPWLGKEFNQDLIKLEQDGNQFRLKMIFSDGAGTYGSEWLIIGNSSLQTILTADENLIIEYLEK